MLRKSTASNAGYLFRAAEFSRGCAALPAFGGRLVAFILGLSLIILSATGPVEAQTASPNEHRRSEIEGIIQDYLLKNPEVIVEALQGLEKRNSVAKQKRQDDVLASRADEIFSDPDSPATGNLNGDVTLVEFFDYRCGYCKRVYPTVKKVLAEDAGVRLVFKEFPILGPESIFASRAALAARWQGKYVQFHDALMKSKGQLPERKVLAIASSVGVDTDVLHRDMTSRASEIDQIIQRNLDLAKDLGVTGTPGFVVKDAVIKGAIDFASFSNLIAAIRAKKN